MIKKLMVTGLASLFMFNTSIALAASFSDVPSSYWAHTQIDTLTNDNIIAGYSDNTFKPENKVTREEFSSMLIRALNQEDLVVNEPMPYPDVKQSMCGYDAINRANSLKLVVGYPATPSNIFKPKGNITKTEALIILANTLVGKKLSMKEATEVLSKFVDGKNVPVWAKETVAKAIKNDVYVKYPDPKKLSPKDFATRAEIADLLYQIRQNPNLLDQYKAQRTEHLAPNKLSSSNKVFVKKSSATIEAGNVIETAFTEKVTAKQIADGTPLKLQVLNDLYTQEGTFLIPAGSIFEGSVSDYQKAKLFNRNAKVSFKLSKLVLKNGTTYDLTAQLANKKGYLTNRYNMRNVRKDLIIAVSTTAVGTGIGALSGIPHNVGKGAGIGAYSSAGVGVLAAIVAPGVDVTFKQGDKVYIKLVSDLQIAR